MRKIYLDQIDVRSESIKIGPQLVGLATDTLDRLALLAPPVVRPVKDRFLCIGNARTVFMCRAALSVTSQRKIRAFVLDRNDWDEDAWRALDGIATLTASNPSLSVRNAQTVRKLLKKLPNPEDPETISALAKGYPDATS